MYKLIRLLLLAAVGLTAYSAALTLYLVPWAWAAIAIGVAYGLFKRGQSLTAYGRARWANITDLPGGEDA